MTDTASHQANITRTVAEHVEKYYKDTLPAMLDYLSNWTTQHSVSYEEMRFAFRAAKLKQAEQRRLKDDNPRTIAAERRAKNAVLVDRIMATGLSEPRAYQLAKATVVKSKKIAAIKAEVFGGRWQQYYCAPKRPGPPQQHIAGLLMRLRPPQASFAAFVDSGTLSDDLALTASALATANDKNELGFLDAAATRGIGSETARLLWCCFVEWCIEIVTDQVIADVRARRALMEDADFG